MIQVHELYDEHSTLIVEHPTLTKLESQGYAPEIKGVYTAYDTTSKTSNAYTVLDLTRWPDSLNNIDVAATDREREYVCGCDGFYYHYAKDNIQPSGECKHIEQLRKQNRADSHSDAAQDTL